MKAICNDGAGHGGPDANETDSESDANVEKEKCRYKSEVLSFC
jgi:hypothetical protein